MLFAGLEMLGEGAFIGLLLLMIRAIFLTLGIGLVGATFQSAPAAADIVAVDVIRITRSIHKLTGVNVNS
jgi:hypothetical protein